MTPESFITFAAAGAKAPNPLMGMLPFVVVIAIFYFLVMRPQQKKQAALKNRVNTLKKGDKVVTSGGLVGVVANFKDEKIVTLKVSDNVRVDVIKDYISYVFDGGEKAPAETSK